MSSGYRGNPGDKKIVIYLDEDGHCAIHSPVDMDTEELIDILTSAVTATTEHAMDELGDEEEAAALQLQTVKKPDYVN